MEPRETYEFIGNDLAEAEILGAITKERLHHGWLISGPRGIGKATLAFRLARYLLTHGDGGADLFGGPPQSLAVEADNPVSQRIAAGGHGDLVLVHRQADPKSSSDKIRKVIVVDQIRELSRFYNHTSAEGGWRIAIIDGAEEMNNNAANALLKMLEEPPARALLLLVCHAPASLPATIRSRCRHLRLQPLKDDQVAEILTRWQPELAATEVTALARLAEGSAGRALSLAQQGGLQIYDEMIMMLSRLPQVDFAAVHGLGDQFQRANGEDSYRLWLDLFRIWLVRLVRAGALGRQEPAIVEGEDDLRQRLLRQGGLDCWVELWEKTNRRVREADRLNLNRKQLLLSTFFDLQAAARGHS